MRPEPTPTQATLRDRDRLISRLQSREATIGVIGLGYVGLPILIEFHRAGFRVVGFDIDEQKIDALRAGESYIMHVPKESIGELAGSSRYRGTSNMDHTSDCDAVLLCVPTPLTAHREPDMTFVERTAASIAGAVRPGQLIALESTTYPGTTEEVLVPILEKGSGLRAGRDFFVAYSPEREDPSNPSFRTATTPKVVGGLTPTCLEIAVALYGSIVEQTVAVSSCAVAEATKLVENIFRCVNIAMVNELKTVFHRMGIDVWEVIDAAKTKPFGYMPFYPGPGLGGHCIPIDPFYLTWKAREVDMPTKFIELAGEINTQMPYYVLLRCMEVLNEYGKALRGAQVLLLGLAYKADVDDMRESPTLKLMELFGEKGAVVSYHDPHIPAIKPNREYPHLEGVASTPLAELQRFDLVVICTAHSAIDYAALARGAALIVDTRNAMEMHGQIGGHIHKA